MQLCIPTPEVGYTLELSLFVYIYHCTAFGPCSTRHMTPTSLFVYCWVVVQAPVVGVVGASSEAAFAMK